MQVCVTAPVGHPTKAAAASQLTASQHHKQLRQCNIVQPLSTDATACDHTLRRGLSNRKEDVGVLWRRGLEARGLREVSEPTRRGAARGDSMGQSERREGLGAIADAPRGLGVG